jgi:putative FmdB family regulatory protein
MPIYEYQCKKCGKAFEVFQGITDPAVNSFKFCRGSVRKLMSLSSFHLKGGGWYATDYGGKKAPAGEKKKEDGTAAAPAPDKSDKSPSASPAKSDS